MELIKLIFFCFVAGSVVGFSFRLFEKIGEQCGDHCVKRYIIWKQKRMGRNK